MPLELLDVVDTAVKIGLGASIAGFTSYLSIRANHANEKNKELRSHKIRTIEMIAEKCEHFIVSHAELRGRLNYTLGLRTTDDEFVLTEEYLNNLVKADENFMSALGSLDVACARLKLLRADKAQKELIKLRSLTVGMRNQVVADCKAPSKIAYEKYNSDVTTNVECFQNELANFYKEIS